jgi:hypothetical protein
MNIKHTTLTIILLIISGFVGYFIDDSQTKKQEQPVIVPLVVQNVVSSVSDLRECIHNLPDTPLKSNLSAVLGAEYADSSDELNEILQAYAVMKLEQLKKEKEKEKENYGKPTTDL